MADFEMPPKRFGGNDNPFAAPESDFTAATASTSDIGDAERIRNEHIGAEASVRAVGALNIIGSIIMIVAGVVLFFVGINSQDGDEKGVSIGLGSLYFGFGILSFVVGRGLRKLKNWARITTAIMSIPGILSPIVWLILYYLLNKKAVYVCTPEYAQIREMTPHVKYKTSIVVKILLGLLVVVFLLIMAALISGSIQ